MDSEQIFKKYYSRLALEGIIKALVCGFIIGFAASLIAALIAHVANIAAVYVILVSLGVMLAAAGISAPIFYFMLFRPKTRQIAERIDRLGLDERLITMIQLEKDESYIAMRQREDAKEKLSRVNRKQLKFSVFIVPVVILAVMAACSISAITVAALNVVPMIEWEEKDPNQQPEYNYVRISYVVGSEGGYIEGETEQFVVYGENAKTVIAVPEDGYVFTTWSDEKVRTPVRTDTEVKEDMIVYVFFQKPEEQDPGSEGPPNFNHQEANNVQNGQKHYLDVYYSDEYYQNAMNSLAEGSISDAYRAIVEAYLNAIR